MALSEKTETRIRLVGTLLGRFHDYMVELEEYGSKSLPNGVTRTDESLLDDFAYWLIKQGD